MQPRRQRKHTVFLRQPGVAQEHRMFALPAGLHYSYGQEVVRIGMRA